MRNRPLSEVMASHVLDGSLILNVIVGTGEIVIVEKDDAVRACGIGV